MNTSLIIFVSLLALAASQMTFSDGWEKRSARAYAQHYNQHKAARFPDEVADAAGVKEEQAKIAPITNCMEEYMAGVRALEAAMMELYSRFQTCENTMAHPLLPHKEKTSRARF